MADDYTIQDLPQVQGGQMNTVDPNTGMFNWNPGQVHGGILGAGVDAMNVSRGNQLAAQMMAQRQLVANMQQMKLKETQRQEAANELQRQFIADNSEADWDQIYRSHLAKGASGPSVQPTVNKVIAGQNSLATADRRAEGQLDVQHLKAGLADSTGAVSPLAASQIDKNAASAANLNSMADFRDAISSYKVDELSARIGLERARATALQVSSGLARYRAGFIPARIANAAVTQIASLTSKIASIRSKVANDAMSKSADKQAALQSADDLEKILVGLKKKLASEPVAPDSTAPGKNTHTVVSASDPLGVLNAR